MLGTGYWSPHEEAWLPDLFEQALGRGARLPRIAGVQEVVGSTAHGASVGPGTGDNMAAALGLGLRPGDVALSIGTSGVASMVTTEPVADGTGALSGFADATGGFLPLACTVNAARILAVGARLLGVDHDGLAALALDSVPAPTASPCSPTSMANGPPPVQGPLAHSTASPAHHPGRPRPRPRRGPALQPG